MIKATERILRFFLTAVGMAGFCLFLLPQTAGCTPRVVISGSMEPAVPVGSIVYTNRWIKQENIKEGDIYCLWVIRGSIGSSQSRGNR